jgi:predicted ester cyclase
MEHPNAVLLRRAWAAYSRGDIEAFASCLTDDWREYGPEGEAGDFATLEDERPTMEAHRLAFPDKHTEIHQIVADDEMVGCICTVSATHTGRYFDVEPTGSTRDDLGDDCRTGLLRAAHRTPGSGSRRQSRVTSPTPPDFV